MHLNGWQRLWVVVAVPWFVVCGLLLVAVKGLPAVYVPPPRFIAWTMTCDLKTVVQRLIDEGEQEHDIAPVIRGAKDSKVGIDIWIPEGADGSRLEFLNCTSAKLVYNPKTKHKQLAAFGTLDSPGLGTFRSGYDHDDILTNAIHERVESSKAERTSAIVIWSVIALMPPAFLYGFGSAVAWVRRGFRHQPPSPSTRA